MAAKTTGGAANVVVRAALGRHFSEVAFKLLSAVEADPRRSNQHEFNGTSELRDLFGRRRSVSPARFIYLSDDLDEPVSADLEITWYDARENRRPRSEYRLYFPANAVSELFSERDLLVIAKRSDGTHWVICARAQSTSASQVAWLFDLPEDLRDKFSIKRCDVGKGRSRQIVQWLLERIGVSVDRQEPDVIDEMLSKFASGFPSTREFSDFARSTLPGVSPEEDPDGALCDWMEHEETLFRALERHLVLDRIKSGFGERVDEFLAFSLTVQNTRKARAGRALENHLEQVFLAQGIQYDRGQVTERTSRPDFIFPGIREYSDREFPEARLSMLGAKSTCKERWRQVLTEADRVAEKHLFTLEPSISRAQTDEMRVNHLRLVLPRALHSTFKADQRGWLLSLLDFIEIARSRQQVS